MAQRIRSCTNSTNLDTINCESYLSKLVKKDKPSTTTKLLNTQKCPRDRSSSNIKNGSSALVLPSASNLKSRQTIPRQTNTRLSNNPTNVVRKELIFDNSALVEVTVRTHTSRRPHGSAGSRFSNEPWGKLLKPTKSCEQYSNYDGFDPLRTLHFLMKELQSKLKTITPMDAKVFEMISDIQHVLTKIPDEVTSATLRSIKGPEIDLQAINNNIMEPPEKLVQPLKPNTTEKGCQTSSHNSHSRNSELFQKQLEASTFKLETSCKQMEKLCNQLKNEKEQIEHLLRTEKETVAFLRKQIQDLQMEKNESTNGAIEKLTLEKQTLQTEMKKLQSRLNAFQGLNLAELQEDLQNMQMEKSRVEQENLNIRHKLMLANMEKEKFIAILNVRDRQVNDIRNEMSQLQDVVNEQLQELQRAPLISAISSQTTLLDNETLLQWQQPQDSNDNSKEIGNAQLVPFEDNLIEMLFKNKSSKELQSGDSSFTNLEPVSSKIIIKENELDKDCELRASETNTACSTRANNALQSQIRGMFSEIKKQALFLSAPPKTRSIANVPD